MGSEPMTLTRVESSMIYAVGYDRDAHSMDVVFLSGRIWRYFGVPQDVYDGLMAAGSKGSYMRNEIIGVYREQRVGKG